jgi:hypothetical protein
LGCFFGETDAIEVQEGEVVVGELVVVEAYTER